MVEAFAELSIPVLVGFAVYLLATLAVTIAVVVVAIARWRETRLYIWLGVDLTLVVFLLGVPAMTVQARFLDIPLPAGVTSLLGPEGIRVVIAVGAVVATVLGAAWIAVQVGVGELAAPGGRPYPLVVWGNRSLSGWAIAAAFGVVAALATELAFNQVEIGVGEVMVFLARFISGFQPQSTTEQMVFLLPSMLGAAVTEEVFFRGIVQGWLAKWLGPGRVGVAGAIVLASGFWALAHVGMTDVVWVKCLQVFLIGLGLGGIARRFSVEASIVGHGVINLTVVVLPFLWGE